MRLFRSSNTVLEPQGGVCEKLHSVHIIVIHASFFMTNQAKKIFALRDDAAVNEMTGLN